MTNDELKEAIFSTLLKREEPKVNQDGSVEFIFLGIKIIKKEEAITIYYTAQDEDYLPFNNNLLLAAILDAAWYRYPRHYEPLNNE